MKPRNPKKNESAEERFQCDNWDADYYRVNVKSQGVGKKPARKVVTKGVSHVMVNVSHSVIVDKLRKGYEVRLEFSGSGQDAIRLFPFMAPDLKHMEVKADTMGAFRTATLADKKAVFARMGKHVSKSDVEEFVREKVNQRMGGESESDYVTPDTMVTCPRCGYKFRVGRKNNES